MRLVVDIGDGRTIEIPLKGNLILHQHNSSSVPQAAPAGDDDDKQYLQQMRGWLMTVGTLFISIAFQAAMQRPSWIPDNWPEVFRTKGASSGAPPTMFAPSPSPTNAAPAAAATTFTYGQAVKAYIYVYCNTMTFATSLTLVLSVLLMNKSPFNKYAILGVKVSMTMVCVAVGCTFAVGNSYGTGATLWVTWNFLFFALWMPLFLFATPRCLDWLVRSRRWRGNQGSI